MAAIRAWLSNGLERKSTAPAFIARTIVSSHGGTIAASDNLARGATFRVLLPRSSVSVS